MGGSAGDSGGGHRESADALAALFGPPPRLRLHRTPARRLPRTGQPLLPPTRRRHPFGVVPGRRRRPDDRVHRIHHAGGAPMASRARKWRSELGPIEECSFGRSMRRDSMNSSMHSFLAPES
ncbi:hypothetical protein OPV22_005341 [Ensete ventricosum]|uniref:Uncharacterized protein n=1 Tax=Ensete ventricosum TaxID=4639 RepID=A0AAV8RNY3_ENSVE|nr:hypothetical protein OPV22_005341 [Ensete ventricosum]